MRAISQNESPATAHHLQDSQNTVLFYGPQGCGKTSLAQALAQKLSICLSDRFNRTNLLNVNSHALFSHHFGVSAKQVGKLFDVVKISSDQTQLLVIVFNEVETLTLSREYGKHRGEVADSMRSTNQLLMGLDRLRGRPNVVFLATANLLAGIDKAFLDRCCVKIEIQNPCDHASYEILRRAINKRIGKGLVICSSLSTDVGDTDINEDMNDDQQAVPCQPSTSITPLHIPELSSYDSIRSVFTTNNIDTVCLELQSVVKRGRGISARKWQHLVNWATFAHTVEIPCDVRVLLSGLNKVLTDELGCRTNAGMREAAEGSGTVPEMTMEDAEEIYRRMFPNQHNDEGN